MPASTSGAVLNNTRASKNRVDPNSHQELLLHEMPPIPDDLLGPNGEAEAEGAQWWVYYCSILLEGNILNRMFITSLHNLCLQHMIRAELIAAIKYAGGLIFMKPTAAPEGGMVFSPTFNPLGRELQTCILNMDKLLASMGFTTYTGSLNSAFNAKRTANINMQINGGQVALFQQEHPPELLDVDTPL